MEVGLSIYLVCLFVLIVMTTVFAIRAFAQWREPGSRTFGLLMLAMVVWAGFYMLEILTPSLPLKMTARKLLYLGMVLSPPLWLGFALRYINYSKWWLQKGRMFILTLPGILAFLLALTNEHHHLIWVPGEQDAGRYTALHLAAGPAFWIITGFAYTMIGLGILVYLSVFFRSTGSDHFSSGVMLAGVTVSAIVNLLFLFAEISPEIDPTPLSFLLSAPLMAFGYFRAGASSILPLTARLVIDQFQDGIIVLNLKNEVTDMNRSARSLLQINDPPQKTVIFDLFPQATLLKTIWESPEKHLKMGWTQDGQNKWLDARVAPLQKDDHEPLGHVIVLHDITEAQELLKSERRRSQQLNLLEEIGRNIADSFDEKEILQRAIDAIIQRFGYALASISVLISEETLEVKVIGGTKDFGYKPGYRQSIHEGIIGHTATTRMTYIANDVSKDPYYYSSLSTSGSAISTPILKQDALYGVLYVESLEPNTFDKVDIKTLETLASQISASLHRAALYDETQQNINVLSTLQNISKAISSSLDMGIIAEKVVHGLQEAFGYTHVSMYLLEEDYLRLAGEVGYPKDMVIPRIHISQGVSGRSIRTKTVQFIEDTTREDVFLKADHNITSEICVPLLKEDKVLGILNIEANNSRRLSHRDVDLLTIIASPIAVAVDNAYLHAQIKRLATIDAVTGLSNRHVFEQTLTAEVERAQRNNSHVSLIIFDIDSFKEYNDKWGHPAGDARLKAMGDMIKKCLRKYDIAARYGGDEFAIILSNADEQEALAFAKRLHEAAQAGTEEPPCEGLGNPGYTLSMGIATFPTDAETQAQLLIAADNAALRAKHLGKNRIQLARDLNP